MQLATWHDSTELPIARYSIHGIRGAFSPAFILIYEDASWEIVSENTNPFTAQHEAIELAEIIGSKLPTWETEDSKILFEQLTHVIEFMKESN